MLEKDTKYFGRVRYKAQNGSVSPWSAPLSFEPKGIEPPSFLVDTDIISSAIEFRLFLSPFASENSNQKSIIVETSLRSDFPFAVYSEETITTGSSAVFYIDAVENRTHYVRFKYVSDIGTQSAWSNVKKVTYKGAASGVTFNNINFHISSFVIDQQGRGDFTIANASNVAYGGISGGNIKTTTLVPQVVSSTIVINTPVGSTTAITGYGTLTQLLEDKYMLSVECLARDPVSNELFNFVLTANSVYPPREVLIPELTGVRTLAPAVGNPSYPSGLPPYVAPTPTKRNGSDTYQLGDGRSVSYSWYWSGQSVIYQQASTISGLGAGMTGSITPPNPIINYSTNILVPNFTATVNTGQYVYETYCGAAYSIVTNEGGQGSSSYPSGLPAYQAPKLYFDLTGTAFQANWSQVHSSTEWQISTSNNFTSIFQSATIATGNLRTLKTNTLVEGTVYYARARYKSIDNIFSAWSNPLVLLTVDSVVNKPRFTSPSNNSTVSGNTVALITSAFVGNNLLTHVSSDWEVSLNNSFTTLLNSSYGNTVNKTSYTATITGASPSVPIYFRVRYIAEDSVTSPWSDVITLQKVPMAISTPSLSSSRQSTAQQGNPSYPSGLPPYKAAQGNPSYPSGLPAYIAPAGIATYPQGLPAYNLTYTRMYATTNSLQQTTLLGVLEGIWIFLDNGTNPGMCWIRGNIISDPNNWYTPGWVTDLGTASATGPSGAPPYRASGNNWTYNASTLTHTAAAKVPITFRFANSSSGFPIEVAWGTVAQKGLPAYPSGLPVYSAGQGNALYPSGLPPYQAAQGDASYPYGLPAYQPAQLYFNLTSSAFSANWSQTHASTEWQIGTSTAFTTIFQSATVSSGNKLVLTTNNMVNGNTYYARVRYRSSEGIYSLWSTAITLS